MAYFKSTFNKFFKDLAKNNHTEWFAENRKIYEKEVKNPFASFVTEMIGRIKEYEPEMDIKTSQAITRINRDIRFSKDKTPYNMHLGANISKYGKKDKAYPGFFFSLGPEKIQIYGGVYMLEKPQLENLRNHIIKSPNEYLEAVSDESFVAHFGEIRGEIQKRFDADFKPLVEKLPILAHKQFYYFAELDADLVESDQLADILMEYYVAARKVNAFLQKAF
jgi:uncharacterized protein (TIGR02453 family)